MHHTFILTPYLTLFYILLFRQVKGTFSRGANICFASCVVVDPASPCLPAECPKAKWKVDNGEKWVTQSDVTVTTM